MERADQVVPTAIDWIERNGGKDDNWFLHVNVWDPHTPYRVPLEYGNPFADDPLPAWMTEELRQKCWDGFGPHSAQEMAGHDLNEAWMSQYPRVPLQLDSMDAVKQWIDGYDMGIWYADIWIGKLLESCKTRAFWRTPSSSSVPITPRARGSSTCGAITRPPTRSVCRVPLLIRWPGITDKNPACAGSQSSAGRVDTAYTTTSTGRRRSSSWRAGRFRRIGTASRMRRRSRRARRRAARTSSPARARGRCSAPSASTTRARRGSCLRTYHDGHKELDPVMLFNLTEDPHETHDLAEARPDLAQKGLALLEDWYQHMMATSRHNVDPLMTVMREGGPFHTRGELPGYIERLKATGRAHHAETLAARHPDEL
jgi:choline-sulfatase